MDEAAPAEDFSSRVLPADNTEVSLIIFIKHYVKNLMFAFLCPLV